MSENETVTTERKTQYERGREDAIRDVGVLLSVCIDSYPAGPSTATVTRMGPNNAALVEDILEQLKRFRTNEVKVAKREAAA